MSDLSYVRAELERLGHSGWERVAKGSRVPKRTIKRIAYRESKDFRNSTISKLAMYFRAQEKRGAA